MSPADRVGLHAELAAAREEAERLRGKLHDAQQFARRLRQDVDAQRKRRDAEAKRFQEALSGVRGTAEEAMAAERRSAEALRRELEEAQQAVAEAERDLGTLRAELAATRDASATLDRLQGELEEQRRLVAEAGEERRRAVEERDTAIQQLAEVRAVVDGVARTEDQLGVQIQRLRAQLSERSEEEETSRSSAAPEP
jgi:chromosome segregation ATPase